MPTYRNDSTHTIRVCGFEYSGEIDIPPGEQRATPYYQHTSDLVKISDTPYYNPVMELHEVSSGERIVPINKDTEILRIQKVSGTTVSVYLQSEDNTPALVKSWDSTDPVIDVPMKGLATQAIVCFAGEGSVQIMEIKSRDDGVIPITQNA